MRISRFWLVVGVYMAGIFVLSSISRLPQPDVPGIDKPEHYLAYGGLAVITFLALRRSRNDLALWLVALLSVGIAAAYGASDELHQRFVPGRTCDVYDWFSDSLGALSGAAVMLIGAKLGRNAPDIGGRDGR